jgi:hypothetical protein
MTTAIQWQVTLATPALPDGVQTDDHLDCFCKNPLNSTYAELDWEAVCRYVSVYNTKNEDFIGTKIYQIFAGYRHCTADLQTSIVTRYSNIYIYIYIYISDKMQGYTVY